MHKLSVGQKLWVVPARYKQAYEAEIVKVGRKFAYLNGRDRLFLNSLRLDGPACGFSGCCYLSRESYEAGRLADTVWRDFWMAVRERHNRPSAASPERIQEAAKILGIKL